MHFRYPTAHGRRSFRAAFTLIELIIVVAIIAILALIALPNLLTAQIRAKVARAKADLRTVAISIDAYNVDNNRYPPPIAYLGSGPYTIEDPSEDEYEAFVPMRVTTPIAYISLLPQDPFGLIKEKTEHPPRATFHYSEQENNAGSEIDLPDFISNRLGTLGVPAAKSCKYFLGSHGPDLQDPQNSPSLYDPTNGVISIGDLCYFGPGIGLY